ncbi:hypothetical protein RHMOL_Rhmol09G0099300 [Rhododendron molle]|uniref:Uncharacterized protein n=1 Tax=Rhododendron molle TaxID=49168 RepID=A0ACC0MBP7_RHOML|nr:hypothetical protein RHMOL_Rhmol09G0099300 [Rhododendron molle]
MKIQIWSILVIMLRDRVWTWLTVRQKVLKLLLECGVAFFGFDLPFAIDWGVLHCSDNSLMDSLFKLSARRRFRRATIEKMEWSPLMLHCSD